MPDVQIKRFKADIALPEAGGDTPEGTIVARFSVFNTRDEEDDVVLPSFFTEGQELPMAAWGHDWGSLPPGKGIIHVDEKGALFDGRFFLDTDTGVQHYRTTKNLGALQQWSFGFRVTDAKVDDWTDGKPARLLIHGDTFEASPVLVGANRQTRTEFVKGQADRLTYADEAETVLVTVEAFIERTKALAALRAGDGRQLSKAHMARLVELRSYLEALLESGEPEPEPGPDIFEPAIAQLHRQYTSMMSAYESAE